MGTATLLSIPIVDDSDGHMEMKITQNPEGLRVKFQDTWDDHALILELPHGCQKSLDAIQQLFTMARDLLCTPIESSTESVTLTFDTDGTSFVAA